MTSTVFQAFRLLFGLILAGFILYFLLSYSGAYGAGEESRIKNDIIKNFITAANDVHQTGVPVSFTQFGESDLDFDLRLDATFTPPTHYPGLESTEITKTLLIPILLLPGDDVYLYRESANIGWWIFYFTEALSDVSFIFVQLDSSTGATDVIASIVDALPQSNYKPEINFGFCDGNDLYYYDLCDGQRCTRNDFDNLVGVYQASSKCTAELPLNHRLITVSSACSASDYDEGVCITPSDSNGIGEAFIKGSAETYFYKNRFGLYKLDLLALVIGGDESNIFGITGENYYQYINNMFSEHIKTASDTMIARSNIMADSLIMSQDCIQQHSSFALILGSIYTLLSNNPQYYNDYSDTNEFLSLLAEADNAYDLLDNYGCGVE